MTGPVLVSSVFVLVVVVLCFLKPNAGRIFLGLFFLVMALGVNGSFTFGNPQAYLDYASGALIPFYRDLAVAVVTFFTPVIFGLLLMAFEIAVALLLLHKGRPVKIGLIGAILFVVGISPMDTLQLVWLGLVVGLGYLLTKEYNVSVHEWVWSRLRPARA